MGEISTIGLDIAKQVFHAHGADASGSTVFSRRITRQKLLEFFAAQPRCTVAMEACAGAHHWGRELQRLGHQVRLIAPSYVTPFGSGRRTMPPMPRRSARRRSARRCGSWR